MGIKFGVTRLTGTGGTSSPTPMPTPSVASSTSKYGLSNFYDLKPIAGHVTPPSGGSQVSDGTQTQETYSTAHVVTVDSSSISMMFSNWYTDGTSEVDNPFSITVAASIELPDGTILPATWNGGRTVVIAPGADSRLCDIMYVELKAGDVIYTRTHVQVSAAGNTWPLGSSTTSPSGIYNAKSGKVVGSNATLATNPTWVSPGNSAYGPSAILGKALVDESPVAAIVGASNTYGYGDVADSVLGFLERACVTQKVPFIKVSKPGEAGGSFAASLKNRRKRMRYVAGATHAILGYGLNDLGAGGTTFAQVAKMVLDNAGFLARVGVKRTYFVTLAPRATSTDGFATTANQTTTATSNYNSTRAAVNAWARAGFPVVAGVAVTPGTANATPSPLLAGIVEMADFVETGRDTGIWKAGHTTDGAHASKHVELAAIVPTFGLTSDVTVTVTPGNGTAPTPPAQATAPGSPTGLTATPGNAQVSLAWTAPSSNGGAVISDYVVEYKTSAGSSWNVFADGVSSTTSAVVTGLTNGTAYDFRVAALNSAGQSGYVSVSSTPVAPAQAYSPTDIPSLQAWYDPTTLSTLADGAAVASWGDKSSNGYTATQSDPTKRPVYRAAGFNGRPCVQFNAQALVSAMVAQPAPFTLSLAIAPTGTGNRTILAASANGGRLVRFSGSTAGQQSTTLVAQGVAQVVQQSPADTYTYRVLLITYDGTNVTIRHNGVVQALGPVTPQNFVAGLTSIIGSRDAAGTVDPFAGSLGDLVQFGAVLSAAQIAAEEQRQATKYGLTLG